MLKNQAVAAPAMGGGIDDAELCQTLADFHGTSARVVMGILLRPYLDAQVLTPTEVIHHAKHLKAVIDQGQTVENALIRVATVQARLPGQEQKARRAALNDAVAQTTAKARAAQLAFAGLARGSGPVEAVLAMPAGRTPTGDLDYDLRAALALDLADHRTWPGKIDRALDLLRADREGRLTGAIDAVLADVLTSPPAVQALFAQPSMVPGAMLSQLCAMVLGATAGVSSSGADRSVVLNGLFRQGRFPEARFAVLERLRRFLRTPQPLGRGAAAEEAELLKLLLPHILTPTGVIGEAAMAEAVTLRYSRRLEQGGASAFRRSVVGLAETQADLFVRLHYLAAVSRCALADRHQGEIVAALDGALGNELLVDSALVQASDPERLRGLMVSAAAAIRGASLPAEDKARVSGRLERLADDSARQGRLFARLRQIESAPRRRVIRLAELACSGLLTESGGLTAVRAHIMDTVRQPQFQAELRAQGQSDLVQMEVRRLLELLDRLRQLGPEPATMQAPSPMQAPPPMPASPPMRPNPVRPASPPPSAVHAVATTVAAPVQASPVQASPVKAGPVRAGPSSDASEMAATVALTAPGMAASPADVAGRCPNCLAEKTGPDCAACGYPATQENRAGIHLMPGTALMGRYHTGRLLGQGGFGATYLGWDDRLHVKVAIKEFYPANLISRVPGSPRVVPFSDIHAEGFAMGLGKFLEEARTLARLRDIKEIVVVQDFFEENATAYLVMELLQGRTFKRYLTESGGAVDAKRALAILGPIMRALQQVHDLGLIHRDISPDNIFITTAGERKLLDFGAARHAASRGASLTVILKPGYAPPEQYSPDGRQGPWTDVYALCATLYGALAGKTPPDATSRFMTDVVPKLSDYGVTVPPAFERVLIAGLAMRYTDRPQSMRELMKAFSAALGA